MIKGAYKTLREGWAQFHTPVILGTWEANARRLQVQDQPYQLCQALPQKKKKKKFKKGWDVKIKSKPPNPSLQILLLLQEWTWIRLQT